MRQRRKNLACAVAVLATCVGLVLPTAAEAAGGIAVLSVTTHAASLTGYRYIDGEVRNDTGWNAQFVRINFDFYDASGRLLGSDYTYSTVDVLAPGGTSPFELIFEEPSGYDHFAITSVASNPTDAPPNHNFDVAITNQGPGSYGDYDVAGTVTNRNSTTSKFVAVVLVWRDSSGAVVEVDETFVNTDNESSLGPGASASFSDSAFPPAGWSTLDVLAQSSTPGDAPPAPTIDTVDNPKYLAGQPVTIRGHAQPGGLVRLLMRNATTYDYQSMGTMTAAGDGSYAFTVNVAYNSSAVVRDANGPSAARTIAVRVKVTIDSVKFQYKDTRGRCVVRFNGGTYPYIPGAPVYIRTTAGTPLGYTTVNQFGSSGRYSALFGLSCGRSYSLFSLISGRSYSGDVYDDNGTGSPVSFSTPR